jgi:hypothetical protein
MITNGGSDHEVVQVRSRYRGSSHHFTKSGVRSRILPRNTVQYLFSPFFSSSIFSFQYSELRSGRSSTDPASGSIPASLAGDSPDNRGRWRDKGRMSNKVRVWDATLLITTWEEGVGAQG